MNSVNGYVQRIVEVYLHERNLVKEGPTLLQRGFLTVVLEAEDSIEHWARS